MQKDLLITEAGDIQLDSQYGIDYVDDNTEIIKALVRRVATNLEGYKRVVKESDGFYLYDSNYGSSLYSYLSAPGVSSLGSTLTEELRRSALEDGRVEIIDVSSQSSQLSTSFVLTLLFRVVGDETIQTATVSF